MNYVENFTKYKGPKPEWFKNDPEITDQQIDSEMLNFEEFEIEDPMLDNYGSFIANLRGSVRAHA